MTQQPFAPPLAGYDSAQATWPCEVDQLAPKVLLKFAEGGLRRGHVSRVLVTSFKDECLLVSKR